MINWKTVLVCGQRDYKDYGSIFRVIEEMIKKYGEDELLILNGAAPGADNLAETIARELEIAYMSIPAQWNKWRKIGNLRAAGAVRNGKMLKALDVPKEIHAFYHNKSASKGTVNMVNQALKMGIPVTEHISE